MYTLGSLFDGSGGFPLAGSLCGIKPVWASEVEPYPIAVTRSRFPDMLHLGDISRINGAEIPPVDIITFGSPCQDLSVAGRRAGLKHEDNGDEETTRSGLFMEAVRIAKEMRKATNGKYPRFLLWENVPGAFSSNKGADFRVVLEELIRIVEADAVMPPVPKGGWAYADSYRGNGWSLAYRVFDAQYWGVPQRRRRIHLVLDLGGECAREILFERNGLRGYFAESGATGETAARNAEAGFGAADREGEGNCVTPIAFDTYNMTPTGDKTVTLRAGSEYNYAPVFVPRTLEQPIAVATQQGGAEITENGICPTITAAAGMSGNNQPWICKPVEVYSIENHPADSRVSIDKSGKVQTLTNRMGTGGGNVPMVLESACYNEAITVHGETISGTLLARDYKGAGRWDSLDKVVCQPCYWDGGQTAGTLTANNDNGAQRMPDKENFNCVIALDRAFYNQGQNALYEPQYYTDGTVPTLVAKGPGAVCVRYIVRRLTPTECARLQGFADRWGDIDRKDSFTDEEYRFWLDVRNTHAAINGKATKEYTKDQMLTWYNKLGTDSAEYKMWGNGIALPPALYCMQGMSDALCE